MPEGSEFSTQLSLLGGQSEQVKDETLVVILKLLQKNAKLTENTVRLSYCNTVCEVLIVEVVKPHIFVVLVYRPPDASLSNFFDITNRIETTLLENNASASDILLLGDFNLPHIKWDIGHASNNATAHGRLLFTELLDNHCYPYI